LRKARLRKVSIVGVCATSGSLVPTFLRSALSGAKPRQLDFNGGNGLAPVSIEKPQRQADADPEIPI